MNRFGRSLALARASLSLLMSDKQLLLFTALSGVFTLMAAVIFMLPAAMVSLGARADGSGGSPPPASVALAFAFYLAVSFITIFFNTALIGCALDRMRGGSATFWDGFDVAMRNVGHIFVYALITATVGMILRGLESRRSLIGPIIGSVLNGAWAVVTFLVIPVMVAENVSPFEAIKRSGKLLRQTWGEQIIGNAGIGLVFFLLALAAAVPVTLGLLAGSAATIAAGFVIGGVYLCGVILIGASVSQIYRAAIYLYTQGGSVTAPFEDWMLNDAFRPRQDKGLSGNI